MAPFVQIQPNIAGMVATASVNSGSVNNVIDLDLNTEWTTGSICSGGGGIGNCCEPVWLEVQFATPQSVRAVAIRNRPSGNREFATGRLELLELNGGVVGSVDLRLTMNGEWAGPVLVPGQVSAVRFRAGFANSPNAGMTELQFFQ